MSEHDGILYDESVIYAIRDELRAVRLDRNATKLELMRERKAGEKAATTNAKLLRLLERHHAAWIEEDQLHPADDKHYVATELCEHTEAAIERAKEKV